MNFQHNKKEPSVNGWTTTWIKFLAKFMPLKKAEKIAESVRLKRLAALEVKNPIIPKRKTITITDWNLAQTARITARENNTRLRNWEAAAPSIYSINKGDFLTNDLGRYSRSCKYTHYTYTPKYTSFVTLAFGGCALLYRYGFVGEMKSRIIKAPKGMKFTGDNDGLCLVRLSDKMDYHPTVEDLQSKNFATRVREQMAKNYTARKESKRLEKSRKHVEEIFQRDLPTTCVTLQDSQRAGNCVAGTLSFLARKLNIDRENVIPAQHLYFVKAPRLLAVANGSIDRVKAAVRAAWERETLVAI